MYEKILVPLDGSRVGEKALPFIEEIACKCAPGRKVQVTLLQVVTELTHPVISPVMEEAAGVINIPYTEEEMEQLKGWAMDYLNKTSKSLKKNKGVTVKCSVRVGADAANEILKAANQMKADLIAISTHGRTGISRWALGSVADKIMRGGDIPVLMVRSGKVS
ncbi:MAG: universal stress protein [Dehalococcoidales bacterium]|nr:universal stress protein [Dehalococcoidales bacterium]